MPHRIDTDKFLMLSLVTSPDVVPMPPEESPGGSGIVREDSLRNNYELLITNDELMCSIKNYECSLVRLPVEEREPDS